MTSDTCFAVVQKPRGDTYVFVFPWSCWRTAILSAVRHAQNPDLDFTMLDVDEVEKQIEKLATTPARKT